MSLFDHHQEDNSGSRNGVQWQNVGPGLALFALSFAFAWVAGGQSAMDALKVAGGLLAATILLGRYMLAGFPPRVAFVVVWVAVTLTWYLIK